MSTQLTRHDCVTGAHVPFFPDTTIDRITDSSGKPLSKILSECNHIVVPFTNNSIRDTRLQVPVALRRKGLWITYVTCQGTVVTEFYNHELTDVNSWVNPNNWVNHLNECIIKREVNKVLSWYKA